MKKSKQVGIFQLSVLSTLMLCTTANNYASDIEIYKAPTAADGKAKVMFVLDVSTYTYQNPTNASGDQVQSIESDYGLNKCLGPATAPSSAKSHQEIRYAGTNYEYTANYCEVEISGANSATDAGCFTALDRPNATPLIPSGRYRCYDRLSTLKESLTAVILNERFWAAEDPNDTTKPYISIGLSFFPTQSAFGSPMAPQLLNAAGRDALRKRISDLKVGDSSTEGLIFPYTSSPTNGQKAQVAQAYGRGVSQLIDSAVSDNSTLKQCSGYGVYTLTAGIPDSDEIQVSAGAREVLTAVLDPNTRTKNPLFNIAACGTGSSDSNTASTSYKSWQCIEKAAELLFAGKNTLNMPIKTAVVSMGKSFGFYSDPNNLSTRDFDLFVAGGSETDTPTTLQMVDQKYSEIAAITNNNNMPTLNNRHYAVRSGVAGGGGYYAVTNAAELKQSIEKFIDGIPEVDIPYITTGAPTIPQDPLNPALVQQNAYYSQFKPTPRIVAAEGSRFWLGNLKKYRINALGRLIDKNNNGILNLSTGELMTNYDYWSPAVSSDTAVKGADENTWGSELYARMGGVKSQLPIGTSLVNSVQVANRKLLTNRQLTTSGTTTTASESTTLTRIGADYSANDPKRSDIMNLLSLRQVGAVMHSPPLLLSNTGKMVYNATNDTLGSTDREDYILFGSTQGLLHVVKADDYTVNAAGVGNGGGKEVFAFVPHEMIENQSKAFLSPDATTGGSANLFYGIDAPWTAYTEYVVDTDGKLTVGVGKNTTQGKQYVYGGLRMGGRSYYSLDLSDMASPALKFHINPDGTTTGPLSYMGQSWSKPKIAWVKWNGSRKLVMFVGGGYDDGYESDSYDQTNKKGAGVYMFDANNGDLLWWASDNASATSSANTTTGVIALKDPNLKYSVPSEIKTADRNNDGLVDHLYFGDLGGQVFRIDLNNNATAIGSFATRSVRLLNIHQTAGKSPRFYAAPAFSIYKDTDSGNLFAAIAIGSGNLSRPLLQYNEGERAYDALYTIYDKDVARVDLFTTTSINTSNVTLSATDALHLNEITNNNRFADSTIIAPYASSSGWYFQFKGSLTTKPVQQEKLFYSPTVIDNDLYVSSYDSSLLGLSGVCGGGVQGESKVRLFCMPFGQCAASRGFNVTNSVSEHGPGIQNHAIGGGSDPNNGGTTRLLGGPVLDTNLDDQYGTKVKLIAQRWYEKY